MVGKSKLYLLIKILLVIGFLVYIKFRIDFTKLYYAIELFQESLSSPSYLIYGLIVLFLMPFNWLLETYKWKLLMPDTEQYRFITSFKIILSGLAIGFFTPFRLGEYVGRLNHVKREDYGLSLYSSLVGSLSQWMASIIVGLGGLWYVYGSFHIDPFLVIFLVLAGISCVFLFFYIEPLLLFFSNYRRFSRLKTLKYSLNSVNSELPYLKILGVSILRFLVFSFQFSLIVNILSGTLINLMELSRSSFMFLIQRFVPLPSFFGIPLRSEISLWVWNDINLDIELFTISTLVIWILNILIPSAIGLIVILMTKYDKT